MNYTSTFPLLINLNGRATYLISLKDKAGLVKMYAFVDVSDYQKVVVTDASKGIVAAANNYLSNVELAGKEDNLVTKEVTVKSIKDVVIDGNTYYYITDTENNKYKVAITVNKELLPFVESGSNIKISYRLVKDVIELVKVNG